MTAGTPCKIKTKNERTFEQGNREKVSDSSGAVGEAPFVPWPDCSRSDSGRTI